MDGLKIIRGRREMEKGCPSGVLFLCFWVGLAGLFGVFVAFAPARAEQANVPAAALTPLVIETATGVHRFQVEVASTPSMQEQGLMHRRSLAPDRGMVFDYSVPRKISMWMKNTLIPLDILFVGTQGQVLKISTDAVPGSLKSIHSGQPVRAVVEVPGGTAVRIGAAPGDRIRHSIFGDTIK